MMVKHGSAGEARREYITYRLNSNMRVYKLDPNC